jgi:hypothetical protein
VSLGQHKKEMRTLTGTLELSNSGVVSYSVELHCKISDVIDMVCFSPCSMLDSHAHLRWQDMRIPAAWGRVFLSRFASFSPLQL